MGPIKFLYNSKFDFTAKSLVTNTVIITRVLFIMYSLCQKIIVSDYFLSFQPRTPTPPPPKSPSPVSEKAPSREISFVFDRDREPSVPQLPDLPPIEIPELPEIKTPEVSSVA